VTSMNKKKFLDRKTTEMGKNCFLFGDIINDSFMTSRAEYENEIKIGFKNTDKEDFNDYLNKYDVVIQGDGNFVIPEYLMRIALCQPVGSDLLLKVRQACPELVHLFKRETITESRVAFEYSV